MARYKTGILILDEPTRGVDIGAKKEIYSNMNDLARARCSDFNDFLRIDGNIGMADRVMVMHEGKQTASLERRLDARKNYALCNRRRRSC